MAKNQIKPNSYHHGDLRKVIINAAQQIIRKRGIQSLSLRELASKIGVSHAAPYRHFPSKESLLAAIAEEGFHKLKKGHEDALSNNSNADTQLLEAGVNYVLLFEREPELVELMFGSAINRKNHPSLQKTAREAFEQLQSTLQNSSAQSNTGKESSRLYEKAIAAWAGVHGLALLFANRQIDVSRFQDQDLRVSIRNIVKNMV